MENVTLDSNLVDGFRKGNVLCFEEIVERYTQKVHNLAVRITRSEQDAEEVLQDVFITVFHKIDRFEGKSAFSSWLYRITVNTAFMKLRKRRQTPTVSLEEVNSSVKECWIGTSSSEHQLNSLFTRHELRAELDQAIAKLPHEYRLIFILRDVDGLSNQEVGEMLNLSVPAVKSRLHRSRLMLRKRLQKYYDDYVNEQVISYGQSREQYTHEKAVWVM